MVARSGEQLVVELANYSEYGVVDSCRGQSAFDDNWRRRSILGWPLPELLATS